MTRTERLLRLARLRGDRLAIATLHRQWIKEHPDYDHSRDHQLGTPPDVHRPGDGCETEAELRAAWGDR